MLCPPTFVVSMSNDGRWTQGRRTKDEGAVGTAVPGTVGGLTVEMGGGSGEVIPEWDGNTERDLDICRIWYSDEPGASKALLAEIPHDTSALPGPAYDAGGNESPRTGELCLSGL